LAIPVSSFTGAQKVGPANQQPCQLLCAIRSKLRFMCILKLETGTSLIAVEPSGVPKTAAHLASISRIASISGVAGQVEAIAH